MVGNRAGYSAPPDDQVPLILEYLDLIAFMRRSVVGSAYRVDDAIPRLIALTEPGQKFMRALAVKHKDGAKEARMATFLEFFRGDLLVDIQKTDISGLRSIISDEIARGDIKHPFVHGPYLYERASQKHEDLRPVLNATETADLLKDMPKGVFQIGHWVCGPEGLLRSSVSRSFFPQLDIPLQHCPDPRCRTLHDVRLTTNFNARINRVIRDIDDPGDEDVSAEEIWRRGIAAFIEEGNRSKTRSPWSGIVWALGDLLTPKEIYLLRQALNGVGNNALNDDENRNAFDVATDLQNIFIFSDDDIIKHLDCLIFTDKIHLGDGEIRTAKINISYNPVNPGVPQISKNGPRVRPETSDISLLRLRRLVERTANSGGTTADRINWLLRSVDGKDANDRVVQAVEQLSPKLVVQALALPSEDDFNQVCATLDLTIPKDSRLDPRSGRADSEFVDAVLWNLGFDTEYHFDSTERIRRQAAKMQEALRDFRATSSLDIERLRAIASNFFTELEGFLVDLVQFSWWVLTQDHIDAARPFAYNDELGSGAWDGLKSASEGAVRGRQVLLRNGLPNGLQTMLVSISTLADSLEELRRNPGRYVRSGGDLIRDPAGLKSIPFKHSKIFLDLLPEAQEDIVRLLREVGSELESADVVSIRNGLMHFGRSTIPEAESSQALEVIMSCLSRLEESGLARSVWRPADSTVDNWGRRSTVIKSSRSGSIRVVRPKPEDTRWLPRLHAAQFVVPIARFTRYDVLRFSLDVTSEHATLWENFPNPRREWRRFEMTSVEVNGFQRPDPNSFTRILQAES